MKIIIIILQAILNLIRKRRDLIANRSKIPPEYRDDVVWYSPKKQRLTNYDVIESYAEDFTYWTINNTSITSAQKKMVIPAGTEIVAATKEYPDLFGGVTIGNGKIKIGIPGIDKDIVLEAADIDHFKSCLK